MNVRKLLPATLSGRTPPRQPDYPDEITPEQLEAIRKLADAGEPKKHTALYAPAW